MIQHLESELAAARAQLADTRRQLTLVQAEQQRLKQTLHDSQQTYGATMAASWVGIYVIQDSRFRYLNPRMAELLGYRIEELIDHFDVAQIVVPEQREWVQDYFRIPEGQPPPTSVSFEFECLRKDGRRFAAMISTRQANFAGKPALVGTLIDISQRRHAEEQLWASEEKWRSLVTNAPDIISSVDHDGNISFINRSFAQFAPTEVLGKPFVTLLPPEYQPTVRKAIAKVFATGQTVQVEVSLGDDPERVWYTNRIGAVKQNSEVSSVIIISTEITEQKRAEQELTEHRSHLERLVQERTAALREANVKLQKDIEQRKKTEWALRESETRYQDLYDNAPDIYFLIAPDGTILSVNRFGAEYLGYNPGELTGRPVWIVVHPEDRTTVQTQIAEIANGHTMPDRLEFRKIRKDGTILWVQESVNRLTLAGDRDTAVLRVICRDITSHKQTLNALRQSEATLRALINATQEDIVVLISGDQRIQVANERVARSLDTTPETLIGARIVDVVPPKVAQRHLEVVRQVLSTGHPVRFEEFCDGHWFDKNFAPALDATGTSLGVAVFARDITARKQMEETARHAKDEAERANAAKSRFLAAASHDLRQPLQALSLFLQVLSYTRADPKSTEIICDMRNALEFMEDLLSTLLDISKLDAGIVQPHFKDFELTEVLQQLQSRFDSVAREKGLALRWVPCRIRVHSDQALLQRVLQNLLSNALRHTHQGKVLLGCRRRGDRVVIEVWDMGEGIPEDQLDKIFEEFYQVGNPARSRDRGLGLGLAIAKRIANLLGHPLTVRSRVSQGSVFSIEVPISRRPVAPCYSQALPDSWQHFHGIPILVIEDDPTVLKATSLLLEQWGFRVLGATCGEDAVRVLRTQGKPPALALVDYRLPEGETGIQALGLIEEALQTEIPAVLFTGDTSPARLREIESSAYPILHKPIDPGILHCTICKLLNRPRSSCLSP